MNELNNSNDLRVKKLGVKSGYEVENEVSVGREFINSMVFPH